ncbi:hypothetical protein INT44_000092 [Umbelopsis vinacea]|uniref:Glutathione S-transferase 3, mitochondrial n=1 Tax=Umbelopsis vinacea TaxID=44442 RepID=A0A8H7UBM9_9FUNG|nr:hypothetical protein INT44_000092 [Umbelopsis vinacea]KAI9287793.1 hypothetical protein BC943DRAFT_318844 [Umbelopsis sp. AD052]
MVALTIPSEYGYVIATGIASSFFVTYLGFKVGGARKAAQIPYPYMYAEKSDAEKDAKKNVFNCTQRAHQNTLEGYPMFLTLLFAGGLGFPCVSAGAGLVFLLGKFFYAQGYSTGEPAKRMRGSFAYLGLLTLLYTSSMTAYNLIK